MYIFMLITIISLFIIGFTGQTDARNAMTINTNTTLIGIELDTVCVLTDCHNYHDLAVQFDNTLPSLSGAYGLDENGNWFREKIKFQHHQLIYPQLGYTKVIMVDPDFETLITYNSVFIRPITTLIGTLQVGYDYVTYNAFFLFPIIIDNGCKSADVIAVDFFINEAIRHVFENCENFDKYDYALNHTIGEYHQTLTNTTIYDFAIELESKFEAQNIEINIDEKDVTENDDLIITYNPIGVNTTNVLNDTTTQHLSNNTFFGINNTNFNNTQ